MNVNDLSITRKQLTAFCRKWKISEFSIFGSALRDDFAPTSDIDVLVTFDPSATHSLFELVEMQEELTRLFGRPVDLVEKAGLRNPFRRNEILGRAKVLYAA